MEKIASSGFVTRKRWFQWVQLFSWCWAVFTVFGLCVMSWRLKNVEYQHWSREPIHLKKLPSNADQGWMKWNAEWMRAARAQDADSKTSESTDLR